MKKFSILQNNKECYICHTTKNLEAHHIFFGPDRKTSEKLGLKVWLCQDHHRGDYSPHQDKDFDLELKQMAEVEFLKSGNLGQWMDVKNGIGRNYL